MEKFVKGTVPRRRSGRSRGAARASRAESVIAKRVGVPIRRAGRQLDVTRTVADVFERARRGNTSYLTRFGVKDAQVVLSREGAETLWQVPDFSIDLQHKNERSVLVGQANLASSKGDWQLEFRTEQRPKRQSLGITALIQDLVPSGLAENFPAVAGAEGARPAGDRRNQRRAFKLRPVPAPAKPISSSRRATSRRPGIPRTPCRSTKAICTCAMRRRNGVFEIEPSTLKWGESQATISGEFRPAGDDAWRAVLELQAQGRRRGARRRGVRARLRSRSMNGRRKAASRPSAAA